MISSKMGRQVMRVVLHPVLFLVYGLSYLFPRSKKIWVFGIPKKFTWSSKYVFLHLANTKEKDIQPVWITRSKELLKELRSFGYPAYFWLSFKGIWFCLRAKWYIIDASLDTINFWLSGGAKELMMWHGIPLKKIERDIKKGESSDAKVWKSKGLARLAIWFLLPWVFHKPDYLISTSSVFQEILAGAFGVAKEKVFVTGFPKNDVYFQDIMGAEVGADRDALLKLRELKKPGSSFKTILYAPTWRDTGGDSFFEKPNDLAKLDDFLSENQLFFFLKLHPLAQAKAFAALKGSYRNIVFVDPDSDADPLLSLTDILVTDYSGIYFEFLLLNRPLVFFPFDYEKYVTRDRELYFEYDKVTPGPKVYNLQDLMEALRKTALGWDEYKADRASIKNMVYQYQDGKAARRVYELLKQLIETRA